MRDVLTVSRAILLGFSREGALPLGKAGARLQVHQTSVTNAVDRLEAQGFVRRVPTSHEWRGTHALPPP